MIKNISPKSLVRYLKILTRRFKALSLVYGSKMLLFRPRFRKPGSRRNVYDIVFIAPPRYAANWILDGIIEELESRFKGYETSKVSAGEALPPAKTYLYMHYIFFIDTYCPSSIPNGSKILIFATHLEPQKHNISNGLVAKSLNLVDQVICMNSNLLDQLQYHGTRPEKLNVIVGGADQELFIPATDIGVREYIGVVCAFYPRKNLSKILDLIKHLPHRSFLCVGKGWEAYEHFKEMESQPNFSYISAEYSEYPSLYCKMKVFLSVSSVEGGPIPLIESMMSNAVPVVSKTGFAVDVIENGVNGILFDVEASYLDIASDIETAWEWDRDIRSSALKFDWDCFASKVETLAFKRPTI